MKKILGVVPSPLTQGNSANPLILPCIRPCTPPPFSFQYEIYLFSHLICAPSLFLPSIKATLCLFYQMQIWLVIIYK